MRFILFGVVSVSAVIKCAHLIVCFLLGPADARSSLFLLLSFALKYFEIHFGLATLDVLSNNNHFEMLTDPSQAGAYKTYMLHCLLLLTASHVRQQFVIEQNPNCV